MLRKICTSAEIPDDSWKVFTFDGGGIEVVVGKRHGKLFAFNNTCPHRGASLSKGEFNCDNIVCYMHGYEYNVFTGKLENMKSWKRESTWVEQSAEWRKSGDLVLYSIIEKDNHIYVDV